MFTVRTKSKQRYVSALVAGLIVLPALTALPASADNDAPPSGYPSWSDVQQAKGNQSAKTAEVAKINSLLSGLQTQSEQLGEAAVQAGATYATAEAALTAASSKVELLQAQVKQASGEVAKYKAQTGTIAAQSYKSGGTNLGLFATLQALGTPNGLQNLDMLSVVGDSASTLYNQASSAEAIVESLTQQEQAAESVRTDLANQAKSSLDAAVAAQQAMQNQVAQEQKQSSTLVAQLASLKNTTVAVEQKYRNGQAALAAYQAAQAAKQKAAEELAAQQAAAAAAAAAAAQAAAATAAEQGQPAPAPAPAAAAPAPAASTPDTSSGFIPVNVLLPNIPGGAVNNPSGAQAYASSQLGSFGWGQDQYQCLVQLWNKESDWLTNATNQSSGAYGIAQALPPGKYASTGSDWLTNYQTQVTWGLGYIRDTYGSPCGAWSHETSMNWY